MVALIRVQMLKNAHVIAQRTQTRNQSEVTQMITHHNAVFVSLLETCCPAGKTDTPFPVFQELACPLNRLLGKENIDSSSFRAVNNRLLFPLVSRGVDC